jgi:Zn-dependent protease
MLELLEGHHAAVRDFHLKRGLFGAMSEEDRQHSAMLTDRSASPTSAKHAGVLVELARIQNKKSSWTGAFVILLVSLGLFVAAGRSDAAMGPKPMELLTILIPILFFHELGHYLAMKVFGYRNLRMFFIPFFGAAVSGRNYTAPGWKKVIVALMGPVPGIILGGLIGIWGAVTHRHWMEQVGLFALLINGFNLLPVLPLDGGHVMHTLLFSRHFVAMRSSS